MRVIPFAAAFCEIAPFSRSDGAQSNLCLRTDVSVGADDARDRRYCNRREPEAPSASAETCSATATGISDSKSPASAFVIWPATERTIPMATSGGPGRTEAMFRSHDCN